VAAGEYVSVSSQSDTERADLAREAQELADNPQHELYELTDIYVKRGVEKSLALEVAAQLMAHDALGAHAKEELGITDALSARPFQAALFSAASFAIGSLLPLVIVGLQPAGSLKIWVASGSLVCLGVLGFASAKTGGSRTTISVARVIFLGAAAMALTAVVGALFGTHMG
jgi:vacuolar iron transporter family protein